VTGKLTVKVVRRISGPEVTSSTCCLKEESNGDDAIQNRSYSDSDSAAIE